MYLVYQRLLKGHPNIVHLIDAAWHKMPNGMFEVFILMEYCPGESFRSVNFVLYSLFLRGWDH